MTNSRNSASAEEALKITGVKVPTLEEALEFIDDDELVEITPKSIRMRKRILNTEMRKKLWNPAKRTGKKYRPSPASHAGDFS